MRTTAETLTVDEVQWLQTKCDELRAFFETRQRHIDELHGRQLSALGALVGHFDRAMSVFLNVDLRKYDNLYGYHPKTQCLVLLEKREVLP